MNIVIAIDSWKGSLSSQEAGNAVAEGIRRAGGQAHITVFPVADGGEGTVDALVQGMRGSYRTVWAVNPLGKKAECRYGILKEGSLAVIETAAAAGLALITEKQRNPMFTTTYGVGEMIKDAIFSGCRKFIIGIGGSATNDGGIGMLQALGFEFLDENAKQVPFGAAGLKDLKEIRQDKVLRELRECEFHIACDVDNVLCGERGCSVVFGPQKGADESMARQMDLWMEQYALLARQINQEADAQRPGSGAAGGLGFAFQTFLNGKLRPGIRIVMEKTGLEAALKEADIVITGEGRLDVQTAMGKAPAGIAKTAKKYGKRVIAFAGSVAENAGILNEEGIDAFFPVLRECITLEEAMRPDQAAANLRNTAEQVFRLLLNT